MSTLLKCYLMVITLKSALVAKHFCYFHHITRKFAIVMLILPALLWALWSTIITNCRILKQIKLNGVHERVRETKREMFCGREWQ